MHGHIPPKIIRKKLTKNWKVVRGISPPSSFSTNPALGNTGLPDPTASTTNIPLWPSDSGSTHQHPEESDFVQIKAAIAQQKLPKDFVVLECESVKNENQHLATVTKRCARYTETALKVPWSTETHTEETLASFNTVLWAQINFLQSEQANLFVQSNFSTDTPKIFRALQSSKNALSDTALENIKTAASLAAVKSQKTQHHAKHIAGRINYILGKLSHLNPMYKWQLHLGIFNLLDSVWVLHRVHRFAAMANTQLPVYNSLFLDPFTSGLDALAQQDWANMNSYVNAPFRLLDCVLDGVVAQTGDATVIAPTWKGQMSKTENNICETTNSVTKQEEKESKTYCS